jgi:hypothetical protein
VAYRLDQAVDRLLEAAAGETTLIIARHGMGAALKAEQLLPESTIVSLLGVDDRYGGAALTFEGSPRCTAFRTRS